MPKAVAGVPRLTGNRAIDRASIAKYDFSDIPRNIGDLTEAQQEKIIRFYATLSLVDLRRRQDINQQQQTAAFEQHNEEASRSLQANEELLTEAVGRSEFGDLRHIKGKRLPDYERRAHGVGPVIY